MEDQAKQMEEKEGIIKEKEGIIKEKEKIIEQLVFNLFTLDRNSEGWRRGQESLTIARTAFIKARRLEKKHYRKRTGAPSADLKERRWHHRASGKTNWIGIAVFLATIVTSSYLSLVVGENSGFQGLGRVARELKRWGWNVRSHPERARSIGRWSWKKGGGSSRNWQKSRCVDLGIGWKRVAEKWAKGS